MLIWGCAIALRKSPATGIERLSEPGARADAAQSAVHRRERAVSWGRRLRATNGRFFTFYRSALERKVDVDITIGDARLKLAQIGDGTFDLLILDAFSSDSIPVHLLTREAVEMYLKKVDERGLLAFHISNRYLRLEPVMAALADALDLVCAIQNDRVPDRTRRQENYYSSDWVVMAKSLQDLKPLGLDRPRSKWRLAASEADFQVWTDDFSNILSVFAWR